VEVIQSKIEDISEEIIPLGAIDVILSELLGIFLVNNRMLETFEIARDRFLRSGGKMYPSSAHLCALPFKDETLYHGVDVTVFKQKTLQEKFS
jgi:histone-arginine methyltransferase CARM1